MYFRRKIHREVRYSKKKFLKCGNSAKNEDFDMLNLFENEEGVYWGQNSEM